jgi:hypothetical protein
MGEVTLNGTQITNTITDEIFLSGVYRFRIVGAALQDENKHVPLKWYNTNTLSGGSTDVNESVLDSIYLATTPRPKHTYLNWIRSATTVTSNRGADVVELTSMTYSWSPKPIRRRGNRMSVLAHGGRRR